MYTPAQFAKAYGVPEARVLMWIDRRFLRADRRKRISEHNRLAMERLYGVSDNPKSTLPK